MVVELAAKDKTLTFTESKWVSIESRWTLTLVTAREVSAHSVQSTGRFIS